LLTTGALLTQAYLPVALERSALELAHVPAATKSVLESQSMQTISTYYVSTVVVSRVERRDVSGWGSGYPSARPAETRSSILAPGPSTRPLYGLRLEP